MSFVRENWLLILVMLSSGTMLLMPLIQRRLSPVKEVSNLNATQLINHRNALLIDLRETREFDEGRLPAAIHIPLSQLATRGQELAKHKARPVVVYCAMGNRSRSASSALSKIGFSEIYQLHGGFRAWKDAGLPVEK